MAQARLDPRLVRAGARRRARRALRRRADRIRGAGGLRVRARERRAAPRRVHQRLGEAVQGLWTRGAVRRVRCPRTASAGRVDEHEVETLFALGAGLHDEPAPTRDVARLAPLVLAGNVPRHDRVVVQASSKYGARGVGADAFAAIVRALADGGRAVAVAGGGADEEFAGVVARKSGAEHATPAALDAWKRLIGGAPALVTPDSGAAHVAGMLGVPCVDLFAADRHVAARHPALAPVGRALSRARRHRSAAAVARRRRCPRGRGTAGGGGRVLNALVVCTGGGIGDVLLATPVMRALRDALRARRRADARRRIATCWQETRISRRCSSTAARCGRWPGALRAGRLRRRRRHVGDRTQRGAAVRWRGFRCASARRGGSTRGCSRAASSCAANSATARRTGRRSCSTTRARSVATPPTRRPSFRFDADRGRRPRASCSRRPGVDGPYRRPASDARDLGARASAGRRRALGALGRALVAALRRSAASSAGPPPTPRSRRPSRDASGGAIARGHDDARRVRRARRTARATSSRWTAVRCTSPPPSARRRSASSRCSPTNRIAGAPLGPRTAIVRPTYPCPPGTARKPAPTSRACAHLDVEPRRRGRRRTARPRSRSASVSCAQRSSSAPITARAFSAACSRRCFEQSACRRRLRGRARQRRFARRHAAPSSRRRATARRCAFTVVDQAERGTRARRATPASRARAASASSSSTTTCCRRRSSSPNTCARTSARPARVVRGGGDQHRELRRPAGRRCGRRPTTAATSSGRRNVSVARERLDARRRTSPKLPRVRLGGHRARAAPARAPARASLFNRVALAYHYKPRAARDRRRRDGARRRARRPAPPCSCAPCIRTGASCSRPGIIRCSLVPRALGRLRRAAAARAARRRTRDRPLCRRASAARRARSRAIAYYDELEREHAADLRIVLSRLDRVGDLILSTPAIASVRRSWPGAHVTIVCSRHNAVVVEGNPDVDDRRDRRARGFDAARFGARFRGDADLAIALAPRDDGLRLVGATRAPRADRLHLRAALRDALDRAPLPHRRLISRGRSGTVRPRSRTTPCGTRSIRCSRLVDAGRRRGAVPRSRRSRSANADRAAVADVPAGAIAFHLAPRWLRDGSTLESMLELIRRTAPLRAADRRDVRRRRRSSWPSAVRVGGRRRRGRRRPAVRGLGGGLREERARRHRRYRRDPRRERDAAADGRPLRTPLLQPQFARMGAVPRAVRCPAQTGRPSRRRRSQRCAEQVVAAVDALLDVMTDQLELSVVIPTYNRLDTLRDVIPALLRSDRRVPTRFEIVVADSQSNDGTAEYLAAIARRASERAPSSGSVHRAARWRATRASRPRAAPVVLFTDADIIASPDLLARHLAHHARRRSRRRGRHGGPGRFARRLRAQARATRQRATRCTRRARQAARRGCTS